MIKKASFIFIIILAISCKQEAKLSVQEKQNFTDKGKNIAKESFKALSSHLMQQMKEGGPAQAIPFCNTEAFPIVDAISKKHNVTIKRTSLQLRNVANKPTLEEEEILNKYTDIKTKNEKLKPIVNLDKEGKAHFYAPILLKDKCMVCHGSVGQEVAVKTDSIIKTIYPNDIATGYKTGDLRGIWSITFNK